MDFTTSNTNQPTQENNTTDNKITLSLVKSGQEEILSQQSTALVSTRDKIKEQIIANGEAKSLSDKLSVNNPQTIIEFGKPIADEISRCADEILRKQDISTLTQTGNMMVSLSKIMDKVDIGEIKSLDKAPGFFERVFSNAQAKIEKMLAKYNNIGTEIEKICVELRTYEHQIEQSNVDLERMYNDGIANYEKLVKYSVAGEYALGEMDQYIENYQATHDINDPATSMELNTLHQTRELLNQRVVDLRYAETVALQSLPIIKSMEFGNLNLSRKINSSFIITIPIFKNACAQAIMAKRQSIQAQAMKALDDKTNEMLMKNAQNAANNMKLTAQLAGSSAIKMETIENSWQTIIDGIRDTKSIQDELAKQRELEKQKIEEVNKKFISQVASTAGIN